MDGSKPDTSTTSSYEDLFPPAEHLTLKSSQVPGVLQIEGKIPQWLYDLGLAPGGESTALEFLLQSNIIPHAIGCAQAFWEKQEEGQWRSGPLHEPDFMGESTRLEAIAFRIGEEKYLHIKKLGLEFEELQQERQKQRDPILQPDQGNSVAVQSYKGPDLIGNSPKMQTLYSQIKEIAFSRKTILLEGEAGTGKTIVAQAIHHSGRMSQGSLIVARPIDFEDFQVERHGSDSQHHDGIRSNLYELDRVKQAVEGTIVVKGFEEISLSKRRKIWEELTYRNSQAPEDHTDNSILWILAVSFRLPELESILSQTSINWIQVPPLRDRKEDILLLCAKFLAEERRNTGNWRVQEIGSAAAQCLCEHSWRGNVNELQETISYAFESCYGQQIEVKDLPPNIQHPSE